MATHSSILAWRIPQSEEPGGYSPWNHRESDTTEHAHMHVKSQVLCGENKLERVNQLHN